MNRFHADPGAGVANNGNVMGITNRRTTGRSQTFTYDELNRIKTAQVLTDWGLSFGYDVWGNLLTQTVTKGSAYPLSVAANTKNQIVGFCYDAAGNLAHQGACPGSSYTYDAENRLTATGGVTYTYDGDGKRVKKSNGTLYWHGAGGEVLAETDLSGVLKREYIYFNGSRVARHDPGGNWFYFADHLGSARVMTWQNGITVEESDYYPFGGERVVLDTVGAPWDNNRKFTGQERDTESGLDYFIARHYAFTLGRFLQPDEFAGGPVDVFSSNDPLPPGPLPYALITNPQSLNKYGYTFNNPLRYTDPTGHCPIGNCVAEMLNVYATEIASKYGLDAAGFLPPPVGPIADGLNAAISFAKGDVAGGLVNLAAIVPFAGDALKGAKMSSKVFSVAVDGGKHSGLIKNMASRSVDEISNGIKSLEKNIAKHENKVANPSKHAKDWDKMSTKEKEGLINKWRNELKTYKEEKEVLEKLKEVKQANTPIQK